MNLQIQCPACSRRFRVHEDLTGKTVECGACDHRFAVGAETMVAEKSKFYPGEHEDDLLSRFGRAPVRENEPVTFQTAQYAPNADAEAVTPTSAAQSFAMFTGVGIILLFAFVFILTSGAGQAFQDVDMVQRMTLGGFVAILGSGLLIVGAKAWRPRAIMLAIGLSVGLMTLILMRPVHITPRSYTERSTDSRTEKNQETPPETSLETEEEAYLKKIGYKSVEKWFEQESDQEQGIDGKDRVIAIYAHPLKESDMIAIEDYFKRKLKLPANKAIIAYRRDDSKARLVVLAGVEESFDQVASYCETLGRVESLPERRVIDLKLFASHFADPSPDQYKKLNDPNHGEFYQANMEELQHISLDRVTKAVENLGRVSPEQQLRFRPEIVSYLMGFLRNETDEDLLEATTSTLRIWAKGDPVITKEMGKIAVKWTEEGRTVPKPMVDFLFENKSDEALFIIDLMWAKDPSRWEEKYESLGEAAEVRLIHHLKSSPKDLKKSATILLRKIGTSKSLPALEEAKGTGDEEFDMLLLRAVETIKTRKE